MTLNPPSAVDFEDQSKCDYGLIESFRLIQNDTKSLIHAVWFSILDSSLEPPHKRSCWRAMNYENWSVIGILQKSQMWSLR